MIKRKFDIDYANGYVLQLVAKPGLVDRIHPPKRRAEKRLAVNEELLACTAMTVKQSARNTAWTATIGTMHAYVQWFNSVWESNVREAISGRSPYMLA
ncbi:hypothetical protein [Paraburkholderia aromaticivorans]|uniref:hypothetical protein n=1 Tax=Paraburkholderia aromaticivorans TaxID=2026199 RepID=UPI0012FE6759|nr:hypothetical protein [Paraburkholderia aromaticivorans]